MSEYVTPDQAASIRELLIAHRQRTGRTQGSLASLVGVHRSQLIRWENGSRQPSLATLRRFVRYRGLTPDERKEVISSVLGINVDTWEPTRTMVRR